MTAGEAWEAEMITETEARDTASDALAEAREALARLCAVAS